MTTDYVTQLLDFKQVQVDSITTQNTTKENVTIQNVNDTVAAEELTKLNELRTLKANLKQQAEADLQALYVDKSTALNDLLALEMNSIRTDLAELDSTQLNDLKGRVNQAISASIQSFNTNVGKELAQLRNQLRDELDATKQAYTDQLNAEAQAMFDNFTTEVTTTYTDKFNNGNGNGNGNGNQ